jgi:hypothetical protein
LESVLQRAGKKCNAGGLNRKILDLYAAEHVAEELDTSGAYAKAASKATDTMGSSQPHDSRRPRDVSRGFGRVVRYDGYIRTLKVGYKPKNSAAGGAAMTPAFA